MLMRDLIEHYNKLIDENNSLHIKAKKISPKLRTVKDSLIVPCLPTKKTETAD